MQELQPLPQATDALGVVDDDLDRQYILLPTVQLIEKAASKFQRPHGNHNPGAMPEWMSLLYKTMTGFSHQTAELDICLTDVSIAQTHVDHFGIVCPLAGSAWSCHCC